MTTDTYNNNVKISIVVTLKNEILNINNLLISIIPQSPRSVYEVIFVDAFSTDGTYDILRSESVNRPSIKVFQHEGNRSEGRNFGIAQATGDVIAFIDADCKMDRNWIYEIEKSIRDGHNVVAGKTVMIGSKEWINLKRVPIFYRKQDISYPSCNIAFKREVLFKTGIFDTTLTTAEDMDLNLRAVKKGYKIFYNDNMLVFHSTRETKKKFLKQAYWNGYGRRQFKRKHGNVWKMEDKIQAIFEINSFWAVARLLIAQLGYTICDLRKGR